MTNTDKLITAGSEAHRSSIWTPCGYPPTRAELEKLLLDNTVIIEREELYGRQENAQGSPR